MAAVLIILALVIAIPVLVMIAACLLERVEARLVPARPRAPRAPLPLRHLRVVSRHSPADRPRPAAPDAEPLRRAS